ncbi:MAG: phosphoadenylyl-sulfate reductase [Desulfuromonadales bacterium]|nr:phosphoadenylyl-sulfate reductase [Desulfuromonadales bacterium]
MNTAPNLATIPVIGVETSPEDIYRIGRDLADGPLALACSFSIDDVVLLDLLRAHLADIEVFAIDTGRLPEETYRTAESVAERFDLRIAWYAPRSEALEQLVRDKGLFSFRENVANRRECCRIRKVEPLQRALRGRAGWITGLRRGQGVTRQDCDAVEIDSANGGLLKINPLVFWTRQQVLAHAEERRLPVNPLHRQGYPSIGCAPCTRAIEPDEDERAGRWWWEDPAHKECGLHRR